MKAIWRGTFGALMRALEQRATERALAQLDERTLRDIGLDAAAERARIDALRNRVLFGLY